MLGARLGRRRIHGRETVDHRLHRSAQAVQVDAEETDLPAIRDIYNDAVLNTTAIWNDARVDTANRRDWLAQRQGAGFPVLVAVGDDEEAIADVLYTYGEERQSRRVARAIVAARPLTTTGELARVVRRALGYKPHDKKDPATRTFQAVRIHVNDELGELEAGLAAAEALLTEGGILAVVSFHSLEDRICKQFLKAASGAGRAVSRHLPGEIPGPPPTFEQVSKAIRPSEEEIARNPRARSSTLRHATRTGAPPRSLAA